MTRAAVLREGPTMLESGVPNYEVINVTGVLAPAGTPADILEKLNAATLKVLSQPAVRERFATIGLDGGAARQASSPRSSRKTLRGGPRW